GTASAVAGRVPDPHRADRGQDLLVSHLAGRRAPVAPGVHRRGRPVAQHPADRLDPEAVTALLHHDDHLVRGRSRPAAKMALAAFRISNVIFSLTILNAV